jgi:hypothetical protein
MTDKKNEGDEERRDVAIIQTKSWLAQFYAATELFVVSLTRAPSLY